MKRRHAAFLFDNIMKEMYTKDQLEQVAQLAAQNAIKQMLASNVNLDNRIGDMNDYSSKKESEDNMSSKYVEAYSYTDEYGSIQSIRFYGKNKKETDAKFQEFLCKPKNVKPVPTLKEFIDNTYRHSFIDGLELTTKANYERYLKLYIIPYMGNIKLNQITLTTLQNFYDWLATAKVHGFKNDINEKSIDRVGGFLNRVLTIATEMDIIKSSPFKVKLLKNNGKPSGHHKALPDSEVDRVKKEVPLLENPCQRIYMGFLIYTGLRREEILGLKWSYINFKEQYGEVKDVVIYPTNSSPIVKDHPKTQKSKRTFLIPNALMEILETTPNKTGYIVHGKDCQKPIAYSSFQKMYKAAFSALGIENFNNHDWRTTFGTQLKESGLTSAQVADILGHADTRMVETVYAPARREGIMKHKDTIERLNKAYASASF